MVALTLNSSTGFRLPNGAVRSTDVAWVRRDRIETLNSAPDKFLPLCPDFVIELRSANDSLGILRIVNQPDSLMGETILPDFVLVLNWLWKN